MWCYITDVTNKITDGTHNSPINTPKGDFKYITAKNIKAHGIELNNISYVSKNIHNEIYARCNPEKGDILYIKDGATTGVVTLNNLDEQFSLLSSVALIKPNKNISNKYLLYYLQSPLCYDSVRGSMKGVGITRITLKQIEKLELPLPPLSEQERIVCQIENWLSLIDTIEKGKDNISITLKQAKSKILDLAIHGKLVPQDPNDEPANELLKRINPKVKITCDNPQYGKLPKGWCETYLGELFNHNTGKALNSSNTEGTMREYLTTSNVYWNTFDFSVVKKMLFKDNELEKCSVTKGDLLVCEGGDIGRAAIWNLNYDICIQNHIHRLRPKVNLCVPFYYYTLYYLKVKNMIGGKGIGLLGLSSNALHKIHCPLPPLSEQHRIVTKIEELFAQLDKIEASL